jgi:hypothetical protein
VVNVKWVSHKSSGKTSVLVVRSATPRGSATFGAFLAWRRKQSRPPKRSASLKNLTMDMSKKNEDYVSESVNTDVLVPALIGNVGADRNSQWNSEDDYVEKNYFTLWTQYCLYRFEIIYSGYLFSHPRNCIHIKSYWCLGSSEDVLIYYHNSSSECHKTFCQG